MLLSSGDTYTSLHTKRQIGKLLLIFLMLCVWIYMSAITYMTYMYLKISYELIPLPKPEGLQYYVRSMFMVCLAGVTGTLFFVASLFMHILKYFTDWE